jgi:uracil-DNA glycosylase family 4
VTRRRRAELLSEMGLAPVWRLRRTGLPRVERVAGTEAQGVTAHEEVAAPLSFESREQRILAMDWPALKAKVAGCTDCRLRSTCKQTVFGVGDERAAWMLVGEAPGADEDRLGEPFVGQAGKLLDNMLAAIGLARGTDVYIANVLKCRPPGNRNPQPDEVAQCAPYLLRQIGLIQPKLIVAMGRFAAQTLLGTDATIASLRGRVHRYAGVPLVVTYHPAYLLRNLPDKAKAWVDLRFAARTIAAAG